MDNCYNKKNNYNNSIFNDDTFLYAKVNTPYMIYLVFHLIMVIIAVYLSWKCNKQNFNLLSFLFALLFPYIYIIYIFSTQGTCGTLSTEKSI